MIERRERGWWVFQHIPPASRRLLDVGCYTATDTATWSPKASNLYGIDIDLAVRKGSPSVHRMQGSGAKLPFPDSIFDVIVFSEVLEHLPASLERGVIEELRRVITTDGTLILTTPHAGWFAWLDPLDTKRRIGLRRGKGHKHYTVSEIERLFSGLFDITNLDLNSLILHPISTWLGLGDQSRWTHLRGKLSDWDYQHHFGRASFNMALTAKPI